MIRRITLAALVAAFVGGSLALPASSKTGPVASASKCKKAKKGKHKKKKRKCGGGGQSSTTLPGQATHPTATPPSGSGTQPGATTRQMSAIDLTDNPVLVGSSTFGQVTISGPAPSGGQEVTLTSSDLTNKVTVPASVVVAAGLTTATFPVNTMAGSPPTTTLTAAIGSSSVQTVLSVVATPSVSSVALERRCFIGPGSFNANRVTLNVPAPADTAVNLSSNNASFPVPSTVTVPSGSKFGLFPVTALAPIVSPVMVTATLGGPVSDSASLYTASAYPDPPAVSDLSLQPSTVTVGEPSTGKVTLACEAQSDTVVTLGSPAGVTVPPTVTVLAGALSATFPISTAASGDYPITASDDAGPEQTTAHLIVSSQPI
jgi:hypothetical protein